MGHALTHLMLWLFEIFNGVVPELEELVLNVRIVFEHGHEGVQTNGLYVGTKVGPGVLKNREFLTMTTHL